MNDHVHLAIWDIDEYDPYADDDVHPATIPDRIGRIVTADSWSVPVDWKERLHGNLSATFDEDGPSSADWAVVTEVLSSAGAVVTDVDGTNVWVLAPIGAVHVGPDPLAEPAHAIPTVHWPWWKQKRTESTTVRLSGGSVHVTSHGHWGIRAVAFRKEDDGTIPVVEDGEHGKTGRIVAVMTRPDIVLGREGTFPSPIDVWNACVKPPVSTALATACPDTWFDALRARVHVSRWIRAGTSRPSARASFVGTISDPSAAKAATGYAIEILGSIPGNTIGWKAGKKHDDVKIRWWHWRGTDPAPATVRKMVREVSEGSQIPFRVPMLFDPFGIVASDIAAVSMLGKLLTGISDTRVVVWDDEVRWTLLTTVVGLPIGQSRPMGVIVHRGPVPSWEEIHESVRRGRWFWMDDDWDSRAPVGVESIRTSKRPSVHLSSLFVDEENGAGWLVRAVRDDRRWPNPPIHDLVVRTVGNADPTSTFALVETIVRNDGPFHDVHIISDDGDRTGLDAVVPFRCHEYPDDYRQWPRIVRKGAWYLGKHVHAVIDELRGHDDS